MADRLTVQLDAAYARMEADAIEGMRRDGIEGQALDDAIAAMKRHNRTAREVFETQIRGGAIPS